MNKQFFAEKVVFWYQKNKRDLPWRTSNEPYFIWLSEIILQQTRVAQGLPYYLKFVEAFPDISAFARAKEEEVLSLWQGLGYYSRARNMHKCARIIIDNYKGRFPDNYNELLKLPGIGPYTAAAIASICYNESVAVVDGNVFRVLSRYFGIKDDIIRHKNKFQNLANELIRFSNPALHNQAMMEFGALHCKPKQPLCKQCDLAAGCIAFKNNIQEKLPVKKAKLKVRHRYIVYLVVETATGILMKQRNNEGIWEGLYDFPLIEFDAKPDDEIIFMQLAKLGISPTDLQKISKVYKHVLTHQILHVCFAQLKRGNRVSALIRQNLNGRAVFKVKKALAALPKPILINRYLEDNRLLS